MKGGGGRASAADRQRNLELLRAMMRIRAFEERLRNMAASGRVPGLVHLYSGQEAVAAGVIGALQPKDWIASHHRGHGHCLAKGARMDALMAEILGKRTGYGLGRVGSMHVIDPETRNLGCNGIVGGGVPLATGAALTTRRNGEDTVAVAFFGDGALNQGIVQECMNMASIWSLPVLFVCENNRYGEFTAIEDVTAGDDLTIRGEVFAIPSRIIDGMDAQATFAAAETAVARARAGEGPSLLICETYRYGGHHVGDAQDYKSEAERAEWAAKDPILRMRKQLASQGVKDATLDDIEREAEDEVARAVAAAQDAPSPAATDVATHIYAD